MKTIELLIVLVSVFFGIVSFYLNHEARKEKEKEEKRKQKEIEKDEKKESLNTGSHTSDVVNSLDLLRNNK